jgi:AcrR family transcriptional regulator
MTTHGSDPPDGDAGKDPGAAQDAQPTIFGLVGPAGGNGIRIRLELLWGRRGRRSRGPKPRLRVERIVEAAIGIADAEGLEALSMRRVAEQLGVGTMSLYRYVPGKDGLIDLMFDTVLTEVKPPDTVPGGWQEKVAHVMRHDWDLYHRHPWVLQVPVNRPPMGPNVVAAFESSLRAISGIGLTAHEMLAVVSLIDAYVRGVARQSLDAAQTEQRTGISDEEWWRSAGEAMDAVIDYSRYPTIVQVAEDGGFDVPAHDPQDRTYFEFGLQRVLDGIQALVDTRATRSD